MPPCTRPSSGTARRSSLAWVTRPAQGQDELSGPRSVPEALCCGAPAGSGGQPHGALPGPAGPADRPPRGQVRGAVGLGRVVCQVARPVVALVLVEMADLLA